MNPSNLAGFDLVVVHVGLVAMLMNATVELFNRACFNYPTLGDFYKHAACDAILQKHKPGHS
jgi:NAD(P) transhydrogenase